MDAESARAFLLKLPHVVETQQWGDNLVLWVGDKALGGKMFCVLDLEGGRHGVVSFLAGAERYAELVEREGLFPAPYSARLFWVAAERWSALRNSEWEAEFRAAHSIVSAKLPARTQAVLAMPAKERAKLVAARRKLLAEREAVAKSAKSAKRTKS
jgi:predicted DNA-binding protein (MmcQ/YjbR family)